MVCWQQGKFTGRGANRICKSRLEACILEIECHSRKMDFHVEPCIGHRIGRNEADVYFLPCIGPCYPLNGRNRLIGRTAAPDQYFDLDPLRNPQRDLAVVSNAPVDWKSVAYSNTINRFYAARKRCAAARRAGTVSGKQELLIRCRRPGRPPRHS